MRRARALALAGLLVAGPVFSAVPTADAPPAWPGDRGSAEVLAAERVSNSLGMSAKLLATAVFAAGRDPEEVVARDLQTPLYLHHDWARTRVEVDRAARRVTLVAPGAPARTAVYTGALAQGAVLLPSGASDLLFEPRPIERRLPPRSAPWPLGDRVDPGSHAPGLDISRLERAVDAAFGESGEAAEQQTRALVVLHRGALVAERYATGFDAGTPLIGWSMGKAVLAALVGSVAVTPAVDLHRPVQLAAWQGADDPRATLTAADLLRMSSGLSCPSPRQDDADHATTRNVHGWVYYGMRDAHAFMLERPAEVAPGSRWAYCNADTLALGALLRQRVESAGGDYLAFPQRVLFDAIGAGSFVLETDQVGNFLISGFNYATARDWARFGELLRRDGLGFDGRRLLRAGWVEFLRTPAPAAPEQRYGGQLWLNAGGAFPSLPRDAFYARGWMEQIVMVIPSREVVIVRLGHSPGLDPPRRFNPWFDGIVAEILAALPAGDAR